MEKSTNTKALLVPAGCTSLVQPLDVSLNKPFKNKMRDEWKRWLDVPVEEQQLTKSGKRQRVNSLMPDLFIIFYEQCQLSIHNPIPSLRCSESDCCTLDYPIPKR